MEIAGFDTGGLIADVIAQSMNADGMKRMQDAVSMAAVAHAGQTISFSETPYIAHPMRVAGLVMAVFECTDPDVVAAALLHDTLEKTSLRPETISKAFGARTLRLVQALTKDENADEAEYWERLDGAGWEARLIKMGDALDHLDCPLQDLPHRIETAGRALALTASKEPPIQNARQALSDSVRAAEVRLAAFLEPG